MLTLGAHMSIAGGFTQAAKMAVEEYGFNAFQLFTKSPRSRQVKPIDPADAQAFREYCFKPVPRGIETPRETEMQALQGSKKNTKETYSNIRRQEFFAADTEEGSKSVSRPRIRSVIAHSSYLLNFGKPMSQIPWALQDIMLDFQRVAELDAHGVVVHIGKSLDGDRKVAMNNVVENAKRVLDSTQKMLRKDAQKPVDYILENTAGQGTEIGFELEELGEIWGKLRGQNPRLKSCLDTAHIWAAGYDISTKEGARRTLKQYDELIGLSTLACFHFNDSLKARGSRVDRHANIGAGFITRNGEELSGLAEILNYGVEKGIPVIMETPEKDGITHHDDLKVVKKMLR